MRDEPSQFLRQFFFSSLFVILLLLSLLYPRLLLSITTTHIGKEEEKNGINCTCQILFNGQFNLINRHKIDRLIEIRFNGNYWKNGRLNVNGLAHLWPSTALHRTRSILSHKSFEIVNNVTDIVYIVLAFVLEILSLRNPPSTNVSLTNEIKKENTYNTLLSLYLNRSRCICCECVCGVVVVVFVVFFSVWEMKMKL